MAIEEVTDWLAAWHRSYSRTLERVAEWCDEMPTPVMFCKGPAIACVAPTYLRFAADVDLEVDCIETCGALASRMKRENYQPKGTLRFRTSERPFLHFTMEKRYEGFVSYVSVSAGFVDAYPDDYGSMTGHPYLWESCGRARPHAVFAGCRVPEPTDWLIRFLIEMTTNCGVRLRDIVDLNTYLRRMGAEVNWDEVDDRVRRFGLEPFWNVCVDCLTDSGIDIQGALGIRPLAMRRRRSASTAALLPRMRRARVSATLPQMRFLVKYTADQDGLGVAAAVGGKTLARNMTYLVTGMWKEALLRRLFSSSWAQRLVLPSTGERQRFAWTAEEVEVMAREAACVPHQSA
jgi:hypothetical protein